jgi:hypothetical protein
MSRQLRPSPHCLNCGAAVATRFCADCGQENTSYRVSLARLVGDLIEEVFQLESRLWRTLWTLVRRPGKLTVEYNAGRRVAYTTPLRLYLIASVTYFFVSGMHQQSNVKLDAANAVELQQEIARTPPGWKRKLLERVAVAQRDPKAASARVADALQTWVPRMMAVMVPLFALLTFALFRRRRRYYVEDLVLALHVHAVAFFLLAIGELARDYLGGLVAFIGAVVWIVVALRRVFGDSRARVAWKLPLLLGGYGLALALGIAAIFVVGALA